MDWQMIVSMFAAVFLSSLKDPKKKKTIRDVSLKIFKALKVAYASDPDFE